MKPHEAKQIVAVIAAAFPRHPMTDQTCRVYERLLLDLDGDVGMQAALRTIATGEFPPTIAALRAAAVDIQHGPRRRGGEAWEDVLAEVRRVGAYDPPRFEDPLTARCVAAIGWDTICRSDNSAADRARFCDLYDELQERAGRDLRAGHALPPARGYGALAAPGTARGPRPAGDAVTGLLGAAGGGSR